VKEHFVKAAEGIITDGSAPNTRLDKMAAERGIKHGLSGDLHHDQAKADRKTNGKKRKLEDMSTGKHMRRDNAPKRIKGSAPQQHVSIVKAADLSSLDDRSESDSECDSSDSDIEPQPEPK
jgi:hypothetical protein